MIPFRISLISMAFSLSVGFSTFSHANGNNTCLEQAGTSADSVHPNLLFLMDHSGSMLDTVRNERGNATNQQRIDVLKQALLTMLDDAHSINVGLGRFASLIKDEISDPPINVPIMFPVTDLDRLVYDIPGEVDGRIMGISVPITQSSDDAEQSLRIGQVRLTNPDLQLILAKNTKEEERLPDYDRQVVGLRFENLNIPNGAKIISASLDFVSGIDATEATYLTINAENTDSSEPFKKIRDNLSDRPLTSSFVFWTPKAWYEGLTYTTPDISSIVQEVVNRPGWCGGHSSLAFIISSEDENPLRNAKSYDDGVAPVLNIKFDSKDIQGNGCINQNWFGQISAEDDDAEEKISGMEYGQTYLKSSTLELGVRSNESRLVGFRFGDIPIGKDAKIIKAHLRLHAKESNQENAFFDIVGELSPNASVFSNSAKNMSNRSKTKTMVNWTPESWEDNQVYQSPDIKEIIQEIIEQDEWKSYNNLALFISGMGSREASSFTNNPKIAATLHIQVEGLLGEGGKGDFLTVRRRLKKLVQQMEIPASKTPIVDALYEAAQYYQGGAVDYGKTRHHYSKYLVSHPGTYNGGTLLLSDDCDLHLDPYNENCANEQIVGTAKYKSPIQSDCQTNHIVLLTDGLATQHTSLEKVQQLIGKNNCLSHYTDPDASEETINVSENEICGIDLADFLADNKNIIIHTIGFQLETGWHTIYEANGKKVFKVDGIYYYEEGNEVPTGTQIVSVNYEEDIELMRRNENASKFLKRLASVNNSGERNFYKADTLEDLINVFQSIFIKVTNTKSTTITSPTARLINISSRALIQGNANDVITGFIISGTGTKKIIIRGWSLEAGVDPKLTLQKFPSGEFVTSNDNWQTNSQAIDIPEMMLPNSTDAGLLLDLPAGAYTATLNSVGTKGLGLLGVDEVEKLGDTAQLINISSRAPIQGGAYDIIAGFMITGTGTKTILIRGFALEPGVDPKITLQTYPNGEFVASNDYWQIDSRANEIPASMALPNSTDAGLLLDLPEGAYTVILSSVGTKGLGLIGIDAIH
ncbi:VWA domain-containing protein [Candidatus Parabeggiatoa sp. HSG14]|uniref:vWA domain-containing protein n=1 Tax=Candidatus Parabeggiatoa sp. HSG14 TaxID=3055593 RepID=UPI0025A87911|nr:VWA domain-containing protein [Thiotrichales bacterium HSG14]